MLELNDLINLAHQARASAARAKREEAYWQALIAERRGDGVTHAVDAPLPKEGRPRLHTVA